jgi:hypothetical protein
VRCGRCGAGVIIIIDQGLFRTGVGRHYVDMYGIRQ